MIAPQSRAQGAPLYFLSTFFFWSKSSCGFFLKMSLFSDPLLTSIFLTGVICLFFPSQRVNLSFDFPFYGHFLREITVATGGKWTLFLDSVLSIVGITVVIGYTVCAWHIRLYTDSFIAAGFKRECGKIYKMSLESGMFLVLGVPVSVVTSHPWIQKRTKQWVISSDVVFGKLHQKIQGWKASSGTNHIMKPRTTLCQRSSQPDTATFTALTSTG